MIYLLIPKFIGTWCDPFPQRDRKHSRGKGQWDWRAGETLLQIPTPHPAEDPLRVEEYSHTSSAQHAGKPVCLSSLTLSHFCICPGKPSWLQSLSASCPCPGNLTSSVPRKLNSLLPLVMGAACWQRHMLLSVSASFHWPSSVGLVRSEIWVSCVAFGSVNHISDRHGYIRLQNP